MISGVRAILAFCLSALAASASAQDPGAGAALFDKTCSACHQKAGVGAPGLAPPLAHPELFATLGDEAPTYLGGVLLSGMTGRLSAKGMDYIGLVMPAHGWLSDAEALAISDYVLQELNAVDPRLTPERLAALRAAPPDHAALVALRRKAMP